ncbi:MAG: FkbM family methyltransferase [Sphingobium sp.]|uniref:FkbM family methyltransferase n=1 Tax=Sphingobium sp. TaxID=1912891 RepID=UPI003BB13687
MIHWLARLRHWLNPTLLGRRQLFGMLGRGDRFVTRHRVRSLCRTVTIGDRLAVTRVLGRYKMYVDPSDYAISVHLMMDGYWELGLSEEIARTVKPGMVVADVGANLGYFTLLMADLVGSSGKVLSFEPNPQVAGLLRRSLHANGFEPIVSHEPDPLGADDGWPVTLYANPDQAGGAFVSIVPHQGYGLAVPLSTRRLDQHPDAMRVAFVKIDAEGSEPAIWEGMAGMLAGDALRTVAMEWAGCRYPDPAAFLNRLLAPGFSLARIHMTKGVVPATREALLAAPAEEEWMLLLRR